VGCGWGKELDNVAFCGGTEFEGGFGAEVDIGGTYGYGECHEYNALLVNILLPNTDILCILVVLSPPNSLHPVPDKLLAAFLHLDFIIMTPLPSPSVNLFRHVHVMIPLPCLSTLLFRHIPPPT
jgi:hypothetical protein